MRIILICILFIFAIFSMAYAKNDFQTLMSDIYCYGKERDNQYAVIFKKQNQEKINHIQSALTNENKRQKPVLEFKEINPTKYRIRVHCANDDFLLVLGQSYHKNWKAIIGSAWKREKVKKIEDIRNAIKNKYSIISGNEEDQASKKEFYTYVEKGWISALGNLDYKKKTYLYNMGNKIIYEKSNPYYIDYISKKIKNSIQNNNLNDGSSFETILISKSTSVIPDNYHWKANGFANSWWINLENIKKTGKYILNYDGSIDFEIVLKYFPEHILNMGILISFATLIISCSFVVKRKIKKMFSIE